MHGPASRPAVEPVPDSIPEEMPEAVMEPLPDLDLVGSGEEPVAAAAALSPDTVGEEETIVIDVPDDYYTPDEHAEMTKAAMARAAEDAAEKGETAADAAAITIEKNEDESRKRRRGLLSRLFPWFSRKG